jgi:hypothetical protein
VTARPVASRRRGPRDAAGFVLAGPADDGRKAYLLLADRCRAFIQN